MGGALVLTTTDHNEIRAALRMLPTTHASTGFIHKSFHQDGLTNFTRKWFAWADYAVWRAGFAPAPD